ncbi:Ran GAP Rna1 [Microbotryomycetes sp. JL221]|nr:Ran GAP Rna1 [Microbotryomycetes sp. JL221]
MTTSAAPTAADRLFSLEGRVLKFDTRESIEEHVQHLQDVSNLEEVRFGGNTLGVDACAAVADALSTKNTLKVADFSDIFTGRLISEIPQSLRSLCTCMLSLPNLQALDLSDNAFGGRSAEPMLELLSTHPTLEVLKLNNNGMGPTGGEMIAQALLANAKKARSEGRTPSLKTLVCGRNRLENGSSQAFADAFAALGSLVEVRMPQNGIRMEGIEAIVNGLKANSNLEVLDLQDNTATERGSRAIAACLDSWPKLRKLNLSDCLLRPKGGISIMSTLDRGTNVKLESLLLQSNELDFRAINLLASAISKHLKELVQLELNGNRGEPEDECYTRVVEALKKWDHEDALDELDELEEYEEDEEEEDADQEDEDGDEEQRKAPDVSNTANGPATASNANDLSDMLGKVHIA